MLGAAIAHVAPSRLPRTGHSMLCPDEENASE